MDLATGSPVVVVGKQHSEGVVVVGRGLTAKGGVQKGDGGGKPGRGGERCSLEGGGIRQSDLQACLSNSTKKFPYYVRSCESLPICPKLKRNR